MQGGGLLRLPLLDRLGASLLGKEVGGKWSAATTSVAAIITLFIENCMAPRDLSDVEV
jgi:hypothetical protein